MSGLIELYNDRRHIYRVLKPFLYNPDLTDNNARIQLRPYLHVLGSYMQFYTLDKLSALNGLHGELKLANLLKDADSTGGLKLSSEDAYSLQALISKMTCDPKWEVGDIHEAINSTPAKTLKSIVSVYNQFCTMSSREEHRINPAQAKLIGGNKRAIWLMFSFYGSAQLIHEDRVEVERLESVDWSVPDPQPRQLPQPVGPQRDQGRMVIPGAANITPEYVASFVFKFMAVDCESPPQLAHVHSGNDDNSCSDLVLEGEENGTRVFSPNCAFCGGSLRGEKSLPRFVKCTHISTFHISCYAVYIARWMNSKSQSKPKVPECPVSGCGWSYTSEQMVTFKCSNETFLPDEPHLATPDQDAPNSFPLQSVFIVDD